MCHALRGGGGVICVINATALLCSGYYYPHLTEEKTQALKSEGMCPKPTPSHDGLAPPCRYSEPESPLCPHPINVISGIYPKEITLC